MSPIFDRQRLHNLESKFSIAKSELQLIAKTSAHTSDERVFAIVHSEFASQERYVKYLKEQIMAGKKNERVGIRFDPVWNSKGPRSILIEWSQSRLMRRLGRTCDPSWVILDLS